MKDALPDVVRRAIGAHLVRSGHRAEDGYPSGEEEEDALTGDLFRAVRRNWTRNVDIESGRWRWRIRTRKFRGRGELATEHLIGADGIVQIEVSTPDGALVRKGLLFQAKKGWRHRDQDLVVQVSRMETVAPGGSAVFDYSPHGYRAATGQATLVANGRPEAGITQRLGEFLAAQFLQCTVGRRDTFYDWERRELVLQGQSTPLSPKFLLAIEAEPEPVDQI